MRPKYASLSLGAKGAGLGSVNAHYARGVGVRVRVTVRRWFCWRRGNAERQDQTKDSSIVVFGRVETGLIAITWTKSTSEQYLNKQKSSQNVLRKQKGIGHLYYSLVLVVHRSRASFEALQYTRHPKNFWGSGHTRRIMVLLEQRSREHF